MTFGSINTDYGIPLGFLVNWIKDLEQMHSDDSTEIFYEINEAYTETIV